MFWLIVNVIEFQCLYKFYVVGGCVIVVLQLLDLIIEVGEVFGIIGYFGVGKLILIWLINCLEEFIGGCLLINGEDVIVLDVDGLCMLCWCIGMIFQYFNLLFLCMVVVNVVFLLELVGMLWVEIDVWVDELLYMVGLEVYVIKYLVQLFGGQKQCVGIVCVFVMCLQILLCDEVISVLDLQIIVFVLKLLGRINCELGLIIVLIMYEMDVICCVCDCVVVFDVGVLVEIGLVIEVFLYLQYLIICCFVIELEQVDEGELYKDFDVVVGCIVCLIFFGVDIYELLFGCIVCDIGVDYNILFGCIDWIKDIFYGQLMVLLVGGDVQVVQVGFVVVGVYFEELC